MNRKNEVYKLKTLALIDADQIKQLRKEIYKLKTKLNNCQNKFIKKKLCELINDEYRGKCRTPYIPCRNCKWNKIIIIKEPTNEHR